MIRSNRSVRRFCVLVVAMLAFAVAMPAGALAQTISPTDEQYEDGVLGLAAGADPVTTSGGSELPFTGLDVAAIAAIGIGLVGAGFAVRRAARPGDDSHPS